MKQTAFEEKKNGEYIPCLKYSVPIFVEKIYKMPRLEVSGAVRPLYWSSGVKGLIHCLRTHSGMETIQLKFVIKSV